MCNKEHRTKGSLTPQVRTRGEQQRAENKRISHATGAELEVSSKEQRTKGSLMPQVRTRGEQQRAENKSLSRHR